MQEDKARAEEAMAAAKRKVDEENDKAILAQARQEV